ncbi:hypothetical protein, partial [Mitsuokella jalaludinii]|uniref:hypothetical protein n=1 Tax=Mitsuokella jalaludinii TaxID=187979 RepID=UPI00307C5148
CAASSSCVSMISWRMISRISSSRLSFINIPAFLLYALYALLYASSHALRMSLRTSDLMQSL